MSGLGNGILQGGDGQRSIPNAADLDAALASEDAACAKLRAAVASNTALLATARALYVIAATLAKDLGVPGVGVAEVLIDLAIEEAGKAAAGGSPA